ncbi:MAG: hypothetical protein KAV41_03090 [Candidatus Pacebacteria bacterium]|nr:hypothetical protein [Candidatus Paceibacterota bacterium]
MTKNNNMPQDVVPPKRSIQDIPLPGGRGKKTTRSSAKRPLGFFGSSQKGENKFARFGKKFWIAAASLAAVFVVFLSFLSSSVVITVIPKQLVQRVDANFIAVSKSEIGGVPFDVMMLDEVGTQGAPVAGEEEILEKANGRIIIFNNYNKMGQRLIKNTRFVTPEGLIYRIKKSVVVPGQKLNEVGKIVPGSVEVTVYADKAGEEYNIGLSDFTVPGFKGGDRFDKFYARSKTAMAGGFEGIKKIAAEEDVAEARLELQAELTQKLTQDILSQIPETFLLYDDALFVASEFLGADSSEDLVNVREKVSVYAVIFNEETLSRHIAENTLEAYKGEALNISNLKDLEFEIKNKEDVKPWTEGRFVFSLKGKANFEWLFGVDKLKNDFVGQAKENVNAILADYSGIESAEVVIKPFWKNSFPRNTGKIEVIKKLEK